MFGEFGGLPIHPLVVHASVMFIMGSALGAIILAIRPGWRHKYGWLLVITSWLSVVAAWISVESGNVLTKVPGLGQDIHAGSGTFLLVCLIPYALLVTLMIYLDRRWHWNVNKHGGVWRDDSPQPKPLILVVILVVLASLFIMGLTIFVGHSGAMASWGDYKEVVSSLAHLSH